MAIKLVVFDMAGTTVEDNDNVATTLQDTLREYNCHVSIANVNTVMGIPKPAAIHTLMHSYNGTLPSAATIAQVYGRFEQKMIYHYNTHAGVCEQRGASALFAQLQQNGVKVGIDTGFSRSVANTIIARLGWMGKGLLDVSVTSDEVENGRPHPDMIFLAMSRMNITDVHEVAKVGDTIADLREGAVAGCRSIGARVTVGCRLRQILSAFSKANSHICILLL